MTVEIIRITILRRLSRERDEAPIVASNSLRRPWKYNIEKLRAALHTEEEFNGLFDFSITSKAPSGEILLQSRKQMKVTWCRSGLFGRRCRHSQSRGAIWFCVPVTESSNNRTSDLRNSGHFFRTA
ncbi:hypothetical protein TNCV_1133971 [Trichonephila clavipes]|nr:hypothetical protein TNCV_1133971 [Trichonephila clavipes]